MVSHANRVPQNPNRKKITPEGGAAYYATVENADNPVTEGAVVNKMMLDEFLAASGTTAGSGAAFTLAQDGFSLFDGALVRIKLNRDMVAGATLNVNGTGAKVIVDGDGNAVGTWLKSGAWVDLVYNSVTGKYVVTGGAGERNKPGDVLLTARNPGSEWVLCNGDEISASTYPDLVGILPQSSLPDKWTMRNISTGDTVGLIGIVYGVGYWVAAGGRKIFYTTNPLTGTWTAVSVPISSYYSISRIKFLQGYFILCISGTANQICYASTPNGTWTVKTLYNYNPYGSINDIEYGNGYWAAVGAYDSDEGDSGGQIFYSASLTGSFSRYGRGGSIAWRIFFVNGIFVTSDATATTPNTWSNIKITAPVNTIRGLIHTNGYWVAAGTGIAYSTSLTGTWTTISAGAAATWEQLKTVNGKIIACGYAGARPCVISANSVTGTWEKREVGTEANDIFGIDLAGGYCVCAGSSSATPYKPIIYAARAADLKLPTIEIPGVKAYMKAKK